MSIVFPKQPSRDIAYQAIKTEMSRLAERRLAVDAYVMVGDPKVPTSWRQVHDADGAYIFAEYSTQTGQTTRKGHALRK